jgi:SAM-dependent methyltransferase/uncharacterized protein YbaR (Trm112 family)
MKISRDEEINLKYIPRPSGDRKPEHSACASWYYHMVRQWVKGFIYDTRLEGILVPLWKALLSFLNSYPNWERIVLLPSLICLSFVMIGWLKVYLRLKRAKVSQLHDLAVDNIDLFVRQYPFHFYPLVCKSLELTYLHNEIPNVRKCEMRFLEVAIGEGSFSSRVFPPGAGVVCMDLSPYSLQKASPMAHIKQAIVCDCLQPPVREGSFDVILANNFLHHVSSKEQVLANWSRIAEKVIFNENTPYWASGWASPYLLRKIGLKDIASAVAARIERDHWQSLKPKAVLEATILKNYEIIKSISYMSEDTFFCCGLFSFLMRCSGPPTPPFLKKLFLGPLRWLAIPVTRNLAKLLIHFDKHQDRSRDTFISYTCKSRCYIPYRTDSYLVCPQCGGELSLSNQCKECGKQFSYREGMLFLLTNELEHIQSDYNPGLGASVSSEHL